MQVDWVCSVGNYEGGYSVDKVSLPAISPKWLLDITDESLPGGHVCTYKNSLYVFSLRREGMCVRGLDLITGETLWEKIHDFNQISQLCVNEEYVSTGYHLLDRKTGEIKADLRIEIHELEETGLGISLLMGDRLLKTKSKFDYDKGYISYQLKDGAYKCLDYRGLVQLATENFLITKSKDKVHCYDSATDLEVWSYELSGQPDRFSKFILTRNYLIVKNNEELMFLRIETGQLVKMLNSGDISRALGHETEFGYDTQLLCLGDKLVILKSNIEEGWLSTFDLRSLCVVACSALAVKVSACVGGEFLFAVDREDNPVAYNLTTLTQCWKGSNPIDATKVIAGSGHIIYVFSGGGLQCYGP